MGLEEVKQQILNEAQQHADTLKGDGEKDAKEILKNVETDILTYKNQVEQDTQRVIETMHKRELGNASFDVKKIVLDTKKDIIDEVMQNVLNALSKENDTARKKRLALLLKKAKSEIDVDVIYINKKDKKLVSGVTVKEIPIIGGLIAETKDRSISVDYSFEELLGNIRKHSIQELNRILFE